MGVAEMLILVGDNAVRIKSEAALVKKLLWPKCAAFVLSRPPAARQTACV